MRNGIMLWGEKGECGVRRKKRDEKWSENLEE